MIPEAPSASTLKHINWLRQCVEGLASPFVSTGELVPPHAISLRFADGVSVALDPYAQTTPSLLVERCQPARYGDGPVTSYNPAVRSALQLNAAGAFTVEGFDPAMSGVLETVRAELCPRDPSPLRAELYSVNVYQRGGHFVRHKDTPRGEAMLGTLVLCVGRTFQGGDLVLAQGKVTQRIRWSGLRRVSGARGTVPWAAFFGDVDHEVERVTWGERVTLTWLLRRDEATAAPAPRVDSLAERLTRGLRRALSDDDFLVDGGTLGFACEHMYADTPGFVRAMPELTTKTLLRLKARDQHIASAAVQAGLAVRLAPYVIDEGCDLRWELSRFPTEKERAVFRKHRITDSDLTNALPIERGAARDDVDWVIAPSGDESGGKRKGNAPGAFLGVAEYSEFGYFGNEGSDGVFYLHGALLIDVPAIGTKARKLLVADAKRVDLEAVSASRGGVKKSAVKTPVEAREYLLRELRELGYTPAMVKKMLAAGEIERTGYGWYRFTSTRP